MIAIENLTKKFGNFCAIDNLNLTVKAGEIFGFIGPNGAGKTTTIKILATLLEPDTGNISIGGHCVQSEPEKARKIMGYMPDYYGVYNGVTVEEYLDFFARAYRIKRAQRKKVVNDCMTLTDTDQIKDKLVSSLSKGMKQRLCLAKTLLHDPKLLILDEPAAGLDPRARIELRSLLKELKKMGKTIFISSHILTELSDMVTSVAILEQGKLVTSGTVDEIASALNSNSSLSVKLYKGKGMEQAQEILQKLSQVVSVEIKEETLEVEYNGEEENVYLLIKALVDFDIPIVEFTYSQRNLENIFMQVTQGELA